LGGSANRTVDDALLQCRHDVGPIDRRRVEAHRIGGELRDLSAENADVYVLRPRGRRVVRFVGDTDADDTLGKHSEQLDALGRQMLVVDAKEIEAGRVYFPHLLVSADQIRYRIDLEYRVIVAVDEGVPHVDHALRDVTEDLLTATKLPRREQLYVEVDIGVCDLLDRFLQDLGRDIVHRMLTGDLEVHGIRKAAR